MKFVRFEKLVEMAGRPQLHLVLADPKKDRVLQGAVKAGRVVTVHQPAVGTKADYGAVGFDPGPARQFLIFPRSLARFKARRIVGIKYERLEEKISRRKAVRRKVAPKRKRASKAVKRPPSPQTAEKAAKPAPEPDLAENLQKALQNLRGGKRAEVLALLREVLESEGAKK
jgi:hypothetical protein